MVEVRYVDGRASMNLGEFLRLCTLVAAGEYDQGDVAEELVSDVAWLELAPEEAALHPAVAESAERAYCLAFDGTHTRDLDSPERRWARTEWEALVERVAEHLQLAAERAGVRVVELDAALAAER